MGAFDWWRRVEPGLVTIVLLSGCGAEFSSERPATVPVRGTVFFQEEPLEDAFVTFRLTDDSRSAFGLTDENGAFWLTTFESEDGAVPGEYRVTVAKTARLPATGFDDQDDPNYEEPADDSSPAAPRSMIPLRYGDPRQTPLKATVPSAGIKSLVFELVEE